MTLLIASMVNQWSWKPCQANQLNKKASKERSKNNSKIRRETKINGTCKEMKKNKNKTNDSQREGGRAEKIQKNRERLNNKILN